MCEWMDAIVKPAAGPGLELRRVPVPQPKGLRITYKAFFSSPL